MARILVHNRKAWLWLCLGIVLFVLSNGRWMVPIAAWIAPIFLLRFVRTSGTLSTIALLFVLIAFATRLMLYGIIPPLGTLTYILTLYYAVIWFLPYLADHLLARNSSAWSTVVFPSVAVSAEYINTILYGSWGAIAYSQVDNLPFLQLASVTGMWGITFAVMWTASCIVRIWETPHADGRPRRLAYIVAASLILIFLFGGLRLALAPETEVVKVATLTTEAQQAQIRTAIEDAGHTSAVDLAVADRQLLDSILDEAHADVFERTRTVATHGARVIVWPEEMIDVLEEFESSFLRRATDVASESGVYILLGYRVLPAADPSVDAENAATLVGPTGEVHFKYLKTYPVPGSTEKPGDGRLPILETAFGKVSTAICYDMDFTGLILQAGRSGVDLMLVPAWDWKAIDPLHAKMAVVRAVENGFSMVRETGEGRSIAVDSFGRALAEKDFFLAPNGEMIAYVPARGVWTVYSVVGDVFAWLSLLIVFIAVWKRLRS